MTKAEYSEISIWEVNNSVSTHLDFGAHILDNYLTSFMNKKMRYCNPSFDFWRDVISKFGRTYF